MRRLPVGDDLTTMLGEPKPVRRLSSSRRSRVWLAEFDGAAAIVKQIVAGEGADDRFSREIAALRLADRARPAVAPLLLATDPGKRVLVLEYLVSRPSAPDWLTDYAVALARLHATTNARDEGVLPVEATAGPDDVRAFIALAGALDVTVPAAAVEELDQLLDRLQPAGHHALLHGNPCRDNDVYTEEGTRFVDFEQASLGNGLTELAYLRVGFPTCWCSIDVSASARIEAESAYHEMWKELTGTDSRDDLADACVGWLIRGNSLVPRAQRGSTDYLARVARRDWHWGTATVRGRLLHRLAVVAGCRDQPTLTNIAELSQAMHDEMHRRWPKLRTLPAGRDDVVEA